jgi:hypothetical protein
MGRAQQPQTLCSAPLLRSAKKARVKRVSSNPMSARVQVVHSRPVVEVRGEMEVQDKTLLGTKRFKAASLAQDGESFVVQHGGTSASYQLSAVTRLACEAELLSVGFAGAPSLVFRLSDANIASRWANLLGQWVSYLRQVPVGSVVVHGGAVGETADRDGLTKSSGGGGGGGGAGSASRREAVETTMQSAASKSFGGAWDDDLHLRLRGRVLQYHRSPRPEDELLGFVHCASIASVSLLGVRADNKRHVLRVAFRGGEAPWELGFETRALAEEWKRALQPQGAGGALMTVGRTVGKIFTKERKSPRLEEAVGAPFNVVRQTKSFEEHQFAMDRAAMHEQSDDDETDLLPEAGYATYGDVDVADLQMRLEEDSTAPQEEAPTPGGRSEEMMEIDMAVFAQDSAVTNDDAEESVATQLQRALSVYDSSSDPAADNMASEFPSEDMISLGETLQAYLEQGDATRLRRLTLLPPQADPLALQRAAAVAAKGARMSRAAAMLKLCEGLEEASASLPPLPPRRVVPSIGGNRRAASPVPSPPAARREAAVRAPQQWVPVSLKHAPANHSAVSASVAASPPAAAASPPPVPPKPKVVPRKGRSPPSTRRKPQQPEEGKAGVEEVALIQELPDPFGDEPAPEEEDDSDLVY